MGGVVRDFDLIGPPLLNVGSARLAWGRGRGRGRGG